MNDTVQPASAERIECPASREPSVRMFILAAMLIGFGAWCFTDSFLRGKYPRPSDGKVSDWVSHYFNWGGGILLPLAGLAPLAWGVVMLKRRLTADAEGIGYEGRPATAWSDVERLDASLLAEKGILRLELRGGGRLTLDGWKLQGFKSLVAFVESHVPASARGEEPAEAEPGDKP